jgi:NAD(P)-dependent dehydrogenase (short-subunit alcohol dehydrogenase family)
MKMLEKFGIKNRVAVVTGGGQGIGKAIASIFAEAGARVLLSDKIAETVQATAQELAGQGGNVLATVSDVRDAAQVDEMMKTALEAFGRIDILVNNAAGNFKTPFLDISEKGWDAVVRATLKSVFLCSQAAAKIMAGQKSGNIINIASMDAFRGTMGAAAYGASKAAVVSLTKTLALELAPYRIRVNAIAPGYIDTPGTAQWKTPEIEEQRKKIIPLSRTGRPEDIATVALFLASEASAYMTGETILVDGGLLLARPY